MIPGFHRDIPTPPPSAVEVFNDIPELGEDEFVLESEGDEPHAAKEMLGFAQGQVYDFRVQGRDGVIRAAEAIGVAPSIEVFEDLEALNVEAADAIQELEAELVEEDENMTSIELQVQESLFAKGMEMSDIKKMMVEYKKLSRDKKFVAEVNSVCDVYGLNYEELSEDTREVLGILSIGSRRVEFSDKDIGVLLNESLKEMLVIQVVRRVDTFTKDINPEKGNELDEDVLKEKLTGVLQSLEAVAKQLPAEQEKNSQIWDILLDRFHKLVAKKGKGTEKFQKVFSNIFSEFNDFIEDNILQEESTRRLKRGEKVLPEMLMQELYGRTQKEMEEVKVQNRAKVVEEILLLKDAPTITKEMIERLHEINNRGIVPKSVSRLRSEDDTKLVTFGKRIGIIGMDVNTEVSDVLERADTVINKKMSKARYEIAVAQLHNDLLDIHPFADRNGSTSVLFMELLMAKRGYIPSPKREKNYYTLVQKIVGNNPVAVGIVAYQHYKIKHQEGYYQGKTSGTPEMKSLYDEALQIHLKAREEMLGQIKESKKKKGE